MLLLVGIWRLQDALKIELMVNRGLGPTSVLLPSYMVYTGSCTCSGPEYVKQSSCGSMLFNVVWGCGMLQHLTQPSKHKNQRQHARPTLRAALRTAQSL